jgi:hypothetical protein
MENEDENEGLENEQVDDSAADTAARPLRFWLRTVDAYITREFMRAFADEGVSRRDWMLLNAVAGDVTVPGFAERAARKGKRLRGLEDRGWVDETGDGTWVLTSEGRDAKERLDGIVEELRARVAGAVSPEDYATTTASLEAMARELGWDEDERMPWGGFGRGFGRRPGFGGDFRPGFGPAWGPGFGPGWGQGFGPGPFGSGGRPGFGPGFGPRPGWEPHPHHEHQGQDERGGYGRGDWPWHQRHGHGHDEWHDAWHGHHGHGGKHGHHGHHRHEDRQADRHEDHHDAEGAYERGFEAGFRRGQSAS